MAAAQGARQLLSCALQHSQPRGKVLGARTPCLGAPLKAPGRGPWVHGGRMWPRWAHGDSREAPICATSGVFWGEAAEPWGPFICCHVLARRVRNWDALHRGGGAHPSRPGAPLRWQGAGRVTGYFPVIGLFAFLCNRVVDTGIAYGDTAVGGVRLLSEPPPSPAAGRPRSAAVGCACPQLSPAQAASNEFG